MKIKEKLLLKTFCIYILIISAISSCKVENNAVDCSTYNYSDCNTIEPHEGNMNIKITINAENPSVPITIYTGKLEDNNILFRDTLSKESFDTLLPIDNYYSITAKYNKGSSVIIAVDGDKISKSKTKTCDSICWSVKTGNTNLKLK